jgi:hypothetical protein
MPRVSSGVDEAAFLRSLECMLDVPSEDALDISGATQFNSEACTVLETILSNKTDEAMKSLCTEHGLHPEAMTYGVTNMAAILADMEAMYIYHLHNFCVTSTYFAAERKWRTKLQRQDAKFQPLSKVSCTGLQTHRTNTRPNCLHQRYSPAVH